MTCPQPSAAEALAALLRDEHAAVYAYGLVGAHLPSAGRRTARAAHDAHRAARDALRTRLVALGEEPPAPLLSYDARVRTPLEARALALRLEEGLAVRWRDLVVLAEDAGLRSVALQQLQACAVRAAQWRRSAGRPPTVPFPGQA